MSYESLCKLGSGFHIVELDESDRRSAGVPPSMSEDEPDMECVRFSLFMRRTSSETQSGFWATVAMCLNERTAKGIMPLLDEATRSQLAEFARRIPGSRVERDREDFSVFSDAGSKRIPDENLAAIRLVLVEPDRQLLLGLLR